MMKIRASRTTKIYRILFGINPFFYTLRTELDDNIS